MKGSKLHEQWILQVTSATLFDHARRWQLIKGAIHLGHQCLGHKLNPVLEPTRTAVTGLAGTVGVRGSCTLGVFRSNTVVTGLAGTVGVLGR